jgi:hypothetical protein
MMQCQLLTFPTLFFSNISLEDMIFKKYIDMSKLAAQMVTLTPSGNFFSKPINLKI